MSESKFPKLIHYEALKQQFEETDLTQTSNDDSDTRCFSVKHHAIQDDQGLIHEDTSSEQVQKKPGLTGTRLRSYAFAVLTRKEYSKADLTDKLLQYAQHKDEVIELVEELARENYQSDQRVAEMTMRSQIRQGKGPNRIKLALRSKKLNKDLVQEDLREIDWYQQAYELKVKKYGTEVSKDPKIKAKQIRFLQYRGFEMDAIMKAISRQSNE